jgi:hypothetical protein
MTPSTNNNNNNKMATLRPYQTREWNNRFQQLVAYKQANGDCNVQQGGYSGNPQLGTWTGTLAVERETKLNVVGFVWTGAREITHDTKWELRF